MNFTTTMILNPSFKLHKHFSYFRLLLHDVNPAHSGIIINEIMKYLLSFSKRVGRGSHRSVWISCSFAVAFHLDFLNGNLVYFPVKQALHFVFCSSISDTLTLISFFYIYCNHFLRKWHLLCHRCQSLDT